VKFSVKKIQVTVANNDAKNNNNNKQKKKIISSFIILFKILAFLPVPNVTEVIITAC